MKLTRKRHSPETQSTTPKSHTQPNTTPHQPYDVHPPIDADSVSSASHDEDSIDQDSNGMPIIFHQDDRSPPHTTQDSSIIDTFHSPIVISYDIIQQLRSLHNMPPLHDEPPPLEVNIGTHVFRFDPSMPPAAPASLPAQEPSSSAQTSSSSVENSTSPNPGLSNSESME